MGALLGRRFSFFLPSRFYALLLLVCLTVSGGGLQAEEITDPKEASAAAMQEGVIAFESKMYDYSKGSFERAVELDRSNYEAMLYLAKVNFFTEAYDIAARHANNLVSSFYPSKDLKIEAFQLLADVENKQGNPWLALSYVRASSDLSTSVDISHLVDKQMEKLPFNKIGYPEFGSDADGVLVSSSLRFDGQSFSENEVSGNFEQMSFAIKSINTKFVVLAGFDERKRFTKLLLIRIKPGLQPKLEELSIQSRSRGGFQGADDLYVKVMDWNFDNYPDLVVRVTSRRADSREAFLLFNPRNENFEISEALSELKDPVLDKKTKAVLEEECTRGKDAACSRKRYKLFAGEYALAQFEKNNCDKTCIYTTAEIEVSSLKTNEHMYLVNTIETQYDSLKSRFSSGASHTIITRRVLKAYYTPNYDVKKSEKPIMTLDLDGSWEFPASYVKSWVNNYFSKQPLDGQLNEPVSDASRDVIN